MNISLKLIIFTLLLAFTASNIFSQNPRTAGEWDDLEIKQAVQEQKYEEGIISYTKTVKLNPRYVETYYYRAAAYIN